MPATREQPVWGALVRSVERGVQTICDLRHADRRELAMIPHLRSFGKVALALPGGLRKRQRRPGGLHRVRQTMGAVSLESPGRRN